MIFGERFKYYRKRCGYTQEEVARALTVTPQAVSKWETAAGTPDISLLVPIAELFGITVDELLASKKKSREDILSELHGIAEDRDEPYSARYERYLDMLKRNPLSADVLSRLLSCSAEWLTYEGELLAAAEKDKLVERAEKFAHRLREKSDHAGTHANSHGLLADIYMAVGNFGKAEKEIACLPYGRYTQARMRGNLADRRGQYEESRIHYGESASDFLVWLFWDMDRLAASYRATDRRKMDQIFKIEYDIIHALYGENRYPLPLQGFLCNATVRLAQRAAWGGECEKALAYLNEFVAVARAWREQAGKTFTTGCVLFPEAMPPYDKPSFVRQGPEKESILHRLAWNAFNSIRDREHFKALLREVEAW